MQGKLVETIRLENGLQVELWDLSRVLAGDRWLVVLEARVNVPLDETVLDTESNLPSKSKAAKVLRDKFGDTIPYVYRQERHFIDQKEVERLLDEFVCLVRNNLLPYLSHPEFSKRLIISKVRELYQKDPRLFMDH
ncbi:MAG TPA: hypothetical protein EYP06_04660 [Desulfobacterales bacterium]|nr:hypothetical protein [Desulfobacterales bacterium]